MSPPPVPTAPMTWRAGRHTFRFPRPTLVMAVVNVTPDSFSDGGRFLDPSAAVDHALECLEQGADILDVGGESTRPGATPVPEDEEKRRVLPVIERLATTTSAPISIDTCKPAVAAEAVRAGASIINDIGTTLRLEAMMRAVAESGAGYIAVHMQGTPQSMQINPAYDDVVREIHDCFRDTLRRLADRGVSPDQVVLDVGIGFGKTLEHNLELLARTSAFTDLQRPLVLGVSRKSFIARILDAPVDARLAGGLAATCLAVERGVSIVRTHDVPETVQALRITEAILARHRP